MHHLTSERELAFPPPKPSIIPPQRQALRIPIITLPVAHELIKRVLHFHLIIHFIHQRVMHSTASRILIRKPLAICLPRLLQLSMNLLCLPPTMRSRDGDCKPFFHTKRLCCCDAEWSCSSDHVQDSGNDDAVQFAFGQSVK